MDTLKGVFAMPKMNHRRDFLRENKLNLQQLQRLTCKKKKVEQTEEKQRQQGLQRQHQNQQQMYLGRRSASQQRPLAGQQPQILVPPKQRSISQQRFKTSTDSTKRDGLGYKMPTEILMPVKTSRSTGTLSSTTSKTSCDKEIQTEDIQDEAFLYHALQKCSSDFSSKVSTTQPQSHPTLYNGYDGDYAHGRHTHFEQVNDAVPRNNLYTQDVGAQAQPANSQQWSHDRGHMYNEELPQLSASRSHASNMNSGGASRLVSDEQLLHTNMEHLSLNNSEAMQQHTLEQPLSGRSRRTICSTKSHESGLSKKTSTSSLQKFGDREEVRLPRYLEREKREREEQRLREAERDPHCPPGHYALSERERLATLNDTEKKFRALVEELNHMPMTVETLRIRTRKGEIERELAALEANIRIFSKPKVYIKEMD